MSAILYERIKQLCAERGVTIARLESDLHFGNSSVKKWGNSTSPSVDKITKVANYFNVSVDYILGRTDIRGQIIDVLGDEDVISFQRARQKMTPQDRERMMKMLKIGFDYAFSDQGDEERPND